jgi:endosialidase-like protein
VRLKTAVTEVPDVVGNLRGVSWDWRIGKEKGAGVIAQDLQKVLPDAVTTDPETGFLMVDYSYVIAALVESHNKLAARVKELEGV